MSFHFARAVFAFIIVLGEGHQGPLRGVDFVPLPVPSDDLVHPLCPRFAAVVALLLPLRRVQYGSVEPSGSSLSTYLLRGSWSFRTAFMHPIGPPMMYRLPPFEYRFWSCWYSLELAGSRR